MQEGMRIKYCYGGISQGMDRVPQPSSERPFRRPALFSRAAAGWQSVLSRWRNVRSEVKQGDPLAWGNTQPPQFLEVIHLLAHEKSFLDQVGVEPVFGQPHALGQPLRAGPIL